MRYVYKPYHGWRHGYRRERICRWIIRIAKALLVAEGMILTVRYLKEHTYENVYEKEVYWTEDTVREHEVPRSSGTVRTDPSPDQNYGGEYYGIGIGTEDGSFFWFHRKTEEMEKMPK